MPKLRLLPFILILLLLCFNACDEDDPPTGSAPAYIGHSSFPSAVGMLWKYEVYDSLTASVDTLWVSVTSGGESPSYAWVCEWRLRRHSIHELESWKVTLGGHLLPSPFYIVADSIQGEPRFREQFAPPFEDGAEWSGPETGDTSRVSFLGSVTVPAKTFSRVARVDRFWNRDEEGGGNWSETWLDEDAGIVKRHFLSQYSDGATITVTKNETWELIEYDLTTFGMHQFPNTLGTQWVYEVANTSWWVNGGIITWVDTVTVTIVDMIVPIIEPSPWGLRMVWEYAGTVYNDTSIIQTAGNTVTVNYDTLLMTPPPPAWSYEFPMAVGRHWGIDTLAPIPIVHNKVSVSTLAGGFETAFGYSMSGDFASMWSVQDWLAPGVGMVKRTYRPPSDMWPSSSQEWNLLSFQPAPENLIAAD